MVLFQPHLRRGSVWNAMVYDEQMDQLIIGASGPSPFNSTMRWPELRTCGRAYGRNLAGP